MSRWNLTDEVKEKHLPAIMNLIQKLEQQDEETIEGMYEESEEYKELTLDLSDTELNPYTLEKLLESLGYQQGDRDSNGWQFDFWVNMWKEGANDIVISGTGITFELKLSPRTDF